MRPSGTVGDFLFLASVTRKTRRSRARPPEGTPSERRGWRCEGPRRVPARTVSVNAPLVAV
ncbi:hypothetical protein BSZ37_21350 [Rubrivirga marina]|uniref:Uncharacterized protein n=1 Tax=Rubrivirga marina TaxID=1196024 RepID=A0A271IST4_9BACT|nr:hypothetical protein BSZ37_21350 [Rubrivirga marina]